MGKHWARQQVRRDELQDALEVGADWVAKNRQLAAMIGGGVAGVLIIAGLLFYRARSMREQAWEQLSMAHAYAFNNQVDTALKQIDTLADESGANTASGFGYLFAGDILYPRGQYQQAMDFYNKLITRGTPESLQPYALADLAVTQEAAGQAVQAAQTAQRFLDAYGDHFLAPQVHALLARAQAAQGQAEAAKTTYQKIVIQYPDTSFAAWAQQRLNGK